MSVYDRKSWRLVPWARSPASSYSPIKLTVTIAGANGDYFLGQRLDLLGWSWDPTSDQWEEGFSHLKTFSDREGHCRVLRSYRSDDGHRLGGRVTEQRNRKDTMDRARRRSSARCALGGNKHLVAPPVILVPMRCDQSGQIVASAHRVWQESHSPLGRQPLTTPSTRRLSGPMLYCFIGKPRRPGGQVRLIEVDWWITTTAAVSDATDLH